MGVCLMQVYHNRHHRVCSVPQASRGNNNKCSCLEETCTNRRAVIRATADTSRYASIMIRTSLVPCQLELHEDVAIGSGNRPVLGQE